MPELSPAAKAVLKACGTPDVDSPFRLVARGFAAAALRAVGDQLKYEYPLSPEYTEWDAGHDAGIHRVINKILAIATELEAQ